MKLLIMVCAAMLCLDAAPRPAGAAEPARVDPRAPSYRWPAVDMDEDGVFDRVDHCVTTPRGCLVNAFGCHTDADRDGVCDGVDRCPGTPAGTRVDAYGCGEEAAEAKQAEPPYVPETPMEKQLVETGTLRLENVYFETASSVLLPESETTLREAGELLEKFGDLRVEIQGHTDTRGSVGYNRRLSQARAEAVRAYLLAHFQLREQDLIATGYGETRPETAERNEEELLRNRRVVLKVLNPEALPRGFRVADEE